MSTILVINSSAQIENSHTRTLASELVQQLNPQGEHRVIERDLAAEPLPHLDGNLIGAFFTPEQQRSEAQAEAVRQSDTLVEELLSSDVLVIAAPMYNFGIPSTLKAWLDHIARVGVTFRYTAEGPEGLVKGKKAYVITARGGVYEGTGLDHQAPHLKTFLGFIGIEDVTFYNAEGMGMDDAREQALASTREAIRGVQAA